ncbi:MerR family transcriptional regulator [Microbacterium gorillae]|uniref:MerR family transcriptional regulator n=1 Tax=Microbacterium gorillae TaxID=1231063 RepID=UPI00058B5A7B|nr:MerR family transcriptional regulator [Microbacterium gorillae]
MDWSIQEVARLAGTTSRTLRHYDDVGLLTPSRIAGNGYRYYDEDALVRLQRILLLRQLGLGLTQIADVLDHEVTEADALSTHLDLLNDERDRLDRQITAVRETIRARKEGEPLMAEKALDGFDHTQYREEVERRWGAEAYRASDQWWRGLGDAAQADWRAAVAQLNADWIAAAEAGENPSGERAQALAARHVAWLRATPGTPAADTTRLRGYLLGLGQMYVADPRFAVNYGGESGAAFVRDALAIWADHMLD